MVTSTLVSDLGSTISGVGDGVSTLSSALAPLPVVGGVLQSAVNTSGNVVDTVGDGLTNGLGQLGSDPQALSKTTAIVGNVVSDVGDGVSDISGKLATSTSSIPLVGGVVTRVAPVLDGVGDKVSMLGDTLTTVTSSGPLGTVTDKVGNNLLVPVVTLAEGLTGKVVSSTGLSAPVGGLIDKVATTVDGLGDKVTATGGGNTLTNTMGGTLNNVATTIGNTSNLTTAPSTGGEPSAAPACWKPSAVRWSTWVPA